MKARSFTLNGKVSLRLPFASIRPAESRPAASDRQLWVIRVAPTGSKASPNVRYAFNSDRICASQQTDAMCQEATFAQSSRRRHPSRQVPAPRPGAARKSLLGLLQRGVQRCAVPPARCERGTAPRPAAVHRECPGVHLQSNWTLREALALGFQRFDQAEVFEDGGMEAIRKVCMSSLNGASG